MKNKLTGKDFFKEMVRLNSLYEDCWATYNSYIGKPNKSELIEISLINIADVERQINKLESTQITIKE